MADQDWIGLMIFKNFVDHDWIGFNFIGSGLDSDWKISQSAHLCCLFVWIWLAGAELGGDRGATSPPKFCLASPVAPKIFQVSFWKSYTDHWQLPLLQNWPLLWPPKWKCLAPPLLVRQDSHKSTQGWKVSFWGSVRGKFSLNIKMNDFVGNILQNPFCACCYILLSGKRPKADTHQSAVLLCYFTVAVA